MLNRFDRTFASVCLVGLVGPAVYAALRTHSIFREITPYLHDASNAIHVPNHFDVESPLLTLNPSAFHVNLWQDTQFLVFDQYPIFEVVCRSCSDVSTYQRSRQHRGKKNQCES
jgi:hypothetical protein